MSLLDYFRLKCSGSLPNPRVKCSGSLPNPSGPSSNRISSTAIALANSEVRAVLNGEPSQGSCKGKKHHVYSPKERAEIGKLAGQIGASKTARRYSKKLGCSLNENTASRFKKLYDEERKRKRMREELKYL